MNDGAILLKAFQRIFVLISLTYVGKVDNKISQKVQPLIFSLFTDKPISCIVIPNSGISQLPRKF